MENQIKCSSKKHEEINAIVFCLECNIYMCNKCSNHHSEILDNHHKYNLNENIQEIFTGICKEPSHNDKLIYYCKNHNQLCCPACLCKIKDKDNGQHTDCNVCLIDEIKEEKRQKLNDNIKYLEDFSDKIENSINELKNIFKKISEYKEDLKMKISKAFTKIRNSVNEREDKLLNDIDNKFDDLFFKEDFINQNEKLPNKIKLSLEKGKKINNNWNNVDNLNSLINDCIKIENNIKNLNDIKKNLENFKNKKIDAIFKFNLDSDNKINELLDKINEFGEITEDLEKLKFKFKPGINYALTNNNLTATKINGNDWDCTIIGDKEIPKNKISKWKIKLNNFKIASNTWNILIGIGPNNPNNEKNFQNKCWSFICGTSNLRNSEGESNYKNNNGKLKKGDIVEVTVNRILGNLSFAINGIDYGVAFNKIPKEEILYPIVLIYDNKQTVEIIDL